MRLNVSVCVHVSSLFQKKYLWNAGASGWSFHLHSRIADLDPPRTGGKPSAESPH